MAEMQKTYDPSSVEERLYRHWEESGAFHQEPDPSRKPFTIVMPPPNITGQLHMGHALDNMMQDVLTRYHRMLGDNTLWLPGTDHASIATEVKLVEQLAEEGKTKADISREEFLERAWKWREKFGGRIVKQLRKLGSSCDWQRERFTMDKGCNRAVTEVFVRLYEKGLIYRGNRIINWCPECLTALSDAEVEYSEQASHLWHIHYPAADGGEGITVATTRPETIFGDTAVAVNPNDERYTNLIGKQLILPLTGRTIPVIADEYVEMEFGSGAVKITPAHDPNDFEVGLRHNLDMPRIMNDDATMSDLCPEQYRGLTREECRKKAVADLEAQGYLVKIEDYAHNVGECYRCHTTVEPIISKQWFVDMKPLAKPALEAVYDGRTKFVPERFSRTYYNWMENIRDWCISRQLWWGHRIPAWYCPCGEIIVSRETPTVCPKCGCTELKQDEDVLDTWFSSALWPFETLGWPDKTPDLEQFFPTDVLVTGYDIIFFWVARMIFSSMEQMGQPPFHTVLVHGLVRDSQGRKMSKSLGNGIDPLEVIDKYGADALRYSLAVGNSPGNDLRFYWERVEAGRNFANKIWNAARFVMMNIGDEPVKPLGEVKLDIADHWILGHLDDAIREITGYLDNYDLGMAAQRCNDFIWDDFCDWFVEMAKTRLYDGTDEEKDAAKSVLCAVITDSMKLLHPFMPFVTEEIGSYLPGVESIMLSSWPTVRGISDAQRVQTMDDAMEMIRRIRNIRSEMGVAPGVRTRLFLRSLDPAQSLAETEAAIRRLAAVGDITWMGADDQKPEKSVAVVTNAVEGFIPMGELIDIEKELARLEKELGKTRGEIARGEGMLGNEKFVARAPQNVVDAERAKLEDNRTLAATLEGRIAELREMA